MKIFPLLSTIVLTFPLTTGLNLHLRINVHMFILPAERERTSIYSQANLWMHASFPWATSEGQRADSLGTNRKSSRREVDLLVTTFSALCHILFNR